MNIIKPHPAAWSYALYVAGGNAARLHVESESVVWVDWRPELTAPKPAARRRRTAVSRVQAQ